jgi:hypothetical protein
MIAIGAGLVNAAAVVPAVFSLFESPPGAALASRVTSGEKKSVPAAKRANELPTYRMVLIFIDFPDFLD